MSDPEVRYLDTTPLAGSAPGAAEAPLIRRPNLRRIAAGRPSAGRSPELRRRRENQHTRPPAIPIGDVQRPVAVAIGRGDLNVQAPHSAPLGLVEADRPKISLRGTRPRGQNDATAPVNCEDTLHHSQQACLPALKALRNHAPDRPDRRASAGERRGDTGHAYRRLGARQPQRGLTTQGDRAVGSPRVTERRIGRLEGPVNRAGSRMQISWF